jgi:hypothetical protein
MEVDDLLHVLPPLGRQLREGPAAHELAQQLSAAGPAVGHEVLVGLSAGDDGEEVVPPLLLPAESQRLAPCRIGAAVAADVY